MGWRSVARAWRATKARPRRRMSMPVESTLPLMVNMAGMIPLIFAQAILQLPVPLGVKDARLGDADHDNNDKHAGPNVAQEGRLFPRIVEREPSSEQHKEHAQQHARHRVGIALVAVGWSPPFLVGAKLHPDASRAKPDAISDQCHADQLCYDQSSLLARLP